MSTERDTVVARQKYVTNQVLDKRRSTPIYTRFTLDTEVHSSECRVRFKSIWIKELAKAEIANRTDDCMPSSPDVREIESLKSTCCDGGSEHRSSR